MGAEFCSLYREIHYIKVRYIEVWVYVVLLTICSSSCSIQSPPSAAGWPPGDSGTRQRTECFNLISRLTPLLPNPCVLACHSSRQLWYILIQWGDRRGYFTYTRLSLRTPLLVVVLLLLMAITGFVIRHTQKINQHYSYTLPSCLPAVGSCIIC